MLDGDLAVFEPHRSPASGDVRRIAMSSTGRRAILGG